MKRKNLAALYRQKQHIEQEGFLRDCWIGTYRPGGTAKGNHSYFQLRSRRPLANGTFSRHLKAEDIARFRRLVNNGRLLRQIERDIARLQRRKLTTRAVLTSSASDEWYTPPFIIDHVRRTMDGIDIDPASSEIAQQWIQAGTYFTLVHNGLNRPWHGRLWLNPPYGQQTHLWTHRAMDAYRLGTVTEAVILVRPAVGTAWYQALATRFPCCVLHRRIRFLDRAGQEQASPIHGNAFFYLGERMTRFREVFAGIGAVSRPC